MPASNLQIITRVLGETIGLFGGVRMTRLAQQASIGDTQLVVERTVGFAPSGKVLLDGVLYLYTGTTATAFTGISVKRGGNPYAGVQAQHSVHAAVIESNRTFSTLDQLKNSLFLQTADGADLTVIGQNLSVPRLPVLSGDDQYRALIKAVAYSARGTLFAVQDALNALLGEGNYELIEDPERMPSRVIIRAPYSSLHDSTTAGRSYLTRELASTANASGVSVGSNSLCAYAVTFAGENRMFDFGLAIPSNFGASFTYESNSGENNLGQLYTQWGKRTTYYTKQTGWYRSQTYRFLPDGRASVFLQAALLNATAKLDTDDGRYFCLNLQDGRVQALLGFFRTANSTKLFVTLIDPTTGAPLPGCPTLPVSASGLDFNEFGLEKSSTAEDKITFSVNGLRATVPLSTLPLSTSAPQVGFGVYIAALGVAGMYQPETNPPRFIQSLTTFEGPAAQFANLRVASRNNVDYSCVQGTDAQLHDNQINATFWQDRDVGNQILISNSTVNRSGGNNNGLYTVTQVAQGTSATVVGPQGKGSVNFNGVLTVSGRVFTYPDDLGKVVDIQGPNLNGQFTITGVFDPDFPTVNLTTFKTPLRTASNVVQLAGVTAADGKVTYSVRPTFVTENNLAKYIMGNTATVTNGRLVPRTPLPFTIASYNVRSDIVPGCQLVDTHQIIRGNNPTGPTPAATQFPLYLTDPLGPVEGYINSLLAAGVVPVFQLT